MIKTLAIAAVVAASGTAGAQAALVYPTSVVTANQNGTIVSADRSVTANALGAADGAFYSLGFGGSITLDYGQLVGGAGVVTEVTYKPINYFEYATLFTSLDGVTFSALGTATNTIAVEGQDFFAPTSFRFLRVVDTSRKAKGRDGFDIDAIGFTVAAVPLPAAGFVLAGGLAGLAALRRRRG